MVKSMTGYGRHVNSYRDTRITIEVRTVNHRFLDLSIKMPKTLLHLEDKMKKLAREYFKRGRIDVFVTIDGTGLVDKNLQVDWNLVDQYMEKINQVKDRYQLTDTVSVKDILQLDDVFFITDQEEEDASFQEILLHTCKKAMKLVAEMRSKEGEAIAYDLGSRTEGIKQIVFKLEQHREKVIEQYRDRIKQRIEEYIKNDLWDQDSRIIQEVALMAEKGDISEEVTRLFSHIDQFLLTLKKEEPIGRRLDFIVQEMHREANTIGSKSNDVNISEWVVELKSEIEKLKEQAQNVE
ncbi:uncharacterized protein (TIGR00255 family) [Salirhabdus euzebyi]|uniref:Uncharacterized protein (TIGR00255 family) n=1 Tax=Salirhabdus euzebyi TaxID=394506 RepID=A0A841Q3P2_9BACI|nr:YicC/YloC family endoribonuclease [Salirhabdus euzebyi]MBB6452980.1 uncharacterized protein (TIGR00255 family) [Salirhabdus euzebyi]